jgi:predicted ATPase
MIFITGEAGIGKTALANAWSESLNRKEVRVAQGQCLDHHGAGESYMPLIEALSRLAASADDVRIKGALAIHAPSWLAQMPSLWTRSERIALEQRGRATCERMLRELSQAVEAIAADMPLVLLLEDIHWSDPSTLDWLAHVARRPDPARLMVLATVRPADSSMITARVGDIVGELVLHAQAHEVVLAPLKLDAIETFLTARFGSTDRVAPSSEIARMLLQRSGGNPLFMVSIVNQLNIQGNAAPALEAFKTVPDDVRRFIDRQIVGLDPDDRALLTAASVVGREFTSAAVAAALVCELVQAEEACARLARQGIFIHRSGLETWPDATTSERYAFRHDLYREIFYDRLPASRRALTHARVGNRLESAWADHPEEIATELAEHFSRGHEPERALRNHQRAARTALRRSANQVAIAHLRAALDALGSIADKPTRARIEVELRVAMGAAFIATRGFGAPEVLETYSRAEALCEGLGELPGLLPAIWGQWIFRHGRGETDVARRLGTRMLALADKCDDPGLRIQAHHALWATSFVRGEFDTACTHARSALVLFDPMVHQAMASQYGNHDAGCCAHNFTGMAQALTGNGEAAKATLDISLTAAEKLDDPFTLALTLYFASAVSQILDDVAAAAAYSESSMRIATEHDLAQPRAWSMGIAGWCRVVNGDVQQGLALASQAIASMQSIQSRHLMTFLMGLLADAYVKAGFKDEAMQTVEEAIAMADATGEHFYDAELSRLRGTLLAHPVSGKKDESVTSFRAAIAIARKQGAKTLELRASESMGQYFGNT